MTISLLGVRPRRCRRNVKEISKTVEETHNNVRLFSVSMCSPFLCVFGFTAIVACDQSQVWPISSWVTLDKLLTLSGFGVFFLE